MRYGVLIGRFQPIHIGHINTIREALDHFDEVRILIGSANLPRTFHNPWTAEERQEMLELALRPVFGERVKISVSNNHPDDVRWAKTLPQSHSYAEGDDCYLIAPGKDAATQQYLGWVVDHNPSIYKGVWVPSRPSYSLSSTGIRNVIFDPQYVDKTVKATFSPYMNEDVISYILQWRHDHKDEYTLLCTEMAYNHKYREEVKQYPRNELTADLCVVNKAGNKVLMVRRGKVPGLGLWAVPGGFVEQDETTFQAAFREFREETNVDLTGRADLYSVIGRDIFDAPSRSPRARIASMVTFIQLKTDEDLHFLPSLPETLAVEWKSPSMIECFEDHYAIAMKGLSLV